MKAAVALSPSACIKKVGARRETAAPISAASFEDRETGLTASSLKRIALSNVPGERFLLRVDGQIKRSLSSKEDAATAGAVIKKTYPVVVVTVVDTDEHSTEIIKA